MFAICIVSSDSSLPIFQNNRFQNDFQSDLFTHQIRQLCQKKQGIINHTK